MILFKEHPVPVEWQSWFAWFPVHIRGVGLVWLEYVEYKSDGSRYDPGYIYRSK